MTDERNESLESEKILEAVRSRKSRSKYGGAFVAVGLLGFVGFAIFFVVTERSMGMGEAGILGTFVILAVIGAGYLEQFKDASAVVTGILNKNK